MSTLADLMLPLQTNGMLVFQKELDSTIPLMSMEMSILPYHINKKRRRSLWGKDALSSTQVVLQVAALWETSALSFPINPLLIYKMDLYYFLCSWSPITEQSPDTLDLVTKSIRNIVNLEVSLFWHFGAEKALALPASNRRYALDTVHFLKSPPLGI